MYNRIQRALFEGWTDIMVIIQVYFIYTAKEAIFNLRLNNLGEKGVKEPLEKSYDSLRYNVCVCS